MSGHTPGPWVIDCKTRGGEICTIYSLPDGFGNGQRWTYIYGESRHPDGAEQVANARLIAAAPDLLAALKRCVEVGAMLANEEAGISSGKNPLHWLDAARAAIAKAEQP